MAYEPSPEERAKLEEIFRRYPPTRKDTPKTRVLKYVAGIQDIVKEIYFSKVGDDPPVQQSLDAIQKIANSPKISWETKDNFFQTMNLEDTFDGVTPEIREMLDRIEPPPSQMGKWTKNNRLLNITVSEWLLSLKPPILEKNEHSRFHKLLEYLEIKTPFEEKDRGIFVVKHDWQKAFKGDIEEEGEIKYPFPVTIFEFRITGRTVIAITYSFDDNRSEDHVFIEWEDKWIGYASNLLEINAPDFLKYVRGQIRAICVMLDSQVAEYTPVRQPVALQQKRKKQNKLPLFDYHVIDLSRRHRTARNPNPIPTGRRVRCHFRRGHWRHFEDHKTWISWMLVGDPDLGFVEKEYKL